MDLFREQGDRFNQADVLIHIADSEVAAGQPEAALAAWEQALAVLGDLHHPRADWVRARIAAGRPGRRAGADPARRDLTSLSAP